MAKKNFQVGIKYGTLPKKGGTKQDNAEGGGVPLPAKTPKCPYDNPAEGSADRDGIEPVI